MSSPFITQSYEGFHPILIVMATFQAIKKAVTGTPTPTVRALPNGIPYAPLLNLAAKAPHDTHGQVTQIQLFTHILHRDHGGLEETQ